MHTGTHTMRALRKPMRMVENVEQLEFSIEEVRHGWFVCRFGEAVIWASNCCGHDGPRQLVKLVTEVLEGERSGGHAVFEAEPGTYVLSIRSGDQATLSLRYTKRNFLDCYPTSAGTVRVHPELPRQLKPEEQLLLVEDLDLYHFVCTVGDAFSAYLPRKMRDRYTGNWMPFPMTELLELRLLLGEDTRNVLTEI